MGFSFAALSAIAKSLTGLLTRIHMERTHTVRILRGVSESDRASLKGNGETTFKR
jgi:hypothetical protein